MNIEQQKAILIHESAGPAKQMQSQYLALIRHQAETLDMGRVMARVRAN